MSKRIYMQYNLRAVKYIGEKPRVFKESIYAPFPTLATGDVVIVDAKTATLLTRPNFGFELTHLNPVEHKKAPIIEMVESAPQSEAVELAPQSEAVELAPQSEAVEQALQNETEIITDDSMEDLLNEAKKQPAKTKKGK